MKPNRFLGYYFSLLDWCSLTYADKHGISGYPDVSWIISALCIVFIFEITALFVYGSKKIKFDLETKEEVE